MFITALKIGGLKSGGLVKLGFLGKLGFIGIFGIVDFIIIILIILAIVAFLILRSRNKNNIIKIVLNDN